MLTANSSKSLVQSCSFTLMCPGWHHLSFTNTAIPPPFFLPLSVAFLSARKSLKPSRVMCESGESSHSHVSVKHMRLHSRYSLCSRVSAISSSILLERDLMFPMMINGKHGLYRLLYRLCASLPLCILFSFSITPWGSPAAPHREGVCGAELTADPGCKTSHVG